MPEEPDDKYDQHTDGAPRPTGTIKRTHDLQQYNGSACLTPLCDQAEVDLEADKWAQLWHEGASKPKLQWGSPEQLPKLTPDEIRLAALSFPIWTGVEVDSISPRAFTRLSNEALEALADLFQKMEATFYWAESLTLVMIVDLTKAFEMVDHSKLLAAAKREDTR